MKKLWFLLLLLAVASSFPGPARALIAGADIFGLDFRLNNPGARANAMGGAFVGLADDATAAYANPPAGLTILTQPEVSVEFKGCEYTTRIVDTAGTTDYDNTASGLSFLSYVYPTKNTVVSIFRHQMLNSESEFSWYQQERQDSPQQRSDIAMNIEAATIGIGLGTKLTDRFSVGLIKVICTRGPVNLLSEVKAMAISG